MHSSYDGVSCSQFIDQAAPLYASSLFIIQYKSTERPSHLCPCIESSHLEDWTEGECAHVFDQLAHNILGILEQLQDTALM